jgi:hypothetical protein
MIGGGVGTAQNTTGKPQVRRCREDETVLNAILSTTSNANRGYIVDTRSQAVADMAHMRGIHLHISTNDYVLRWRVRNGSTLFTLETCS